MARQQRVLIVGGGIGGLAAAVALRRKGIETEIYEQATELTEIGAGLSVWPNRTTVLQDFGLLAEALSHGSRLDLFRLQTWKGKVLTETTAVGECATPSMSIHRARLLALLKAALPSDSILLGTRFENLEERQGKIVAQFAGGRSAEGDALIGSDGLYSTVRARILGPAKPRYRGYQAWRGLADYSSKQIPLNTAVETWGVGARFGFEPMGNGSFFWYATRNAPEGKLGDPKSWKSEVTQNFESWISPIPELVQATPCRSILKHEIFDRPPVRRLGRGRVTLLGDAGNPTTPNLGQGACMALEDAVVLAECLSGNQEFPEALPKYESLRYRRRKFITGESRRIGWIGQWRSQAGIAMRTVLLRLAQRSLVNFQHRRYYAFSA